MTAADERRATVTVSGTGTAGRPADLAQATFVAEAISETPAAEEARRAAVADAWRRAAIIADATGGRLGALLGISEGSASVPGPFPATRMLAMAAGSAPTPVMPGRIEVSVTVTAEWEIDPAG